MGGVCGIGSIKGRLSPIGSLQGALSIPVGGSMDCDIYEGEYKVIATETKTLSDDGLTISTDVVYG